MVSFDDLVERLSSREKNVEDLSSFIEARSDQVAEEIRSGSLKIVDLVKGLNPVLTNGGHEVRANGVKFLVQVVTKLPNVLLNEKEIEILTEFMCLRLIDHKSMEQPALRCLTYFIDCVNKPTKYNKQLVEFIANKSNPHRMDARNRRMIYELLKLVVAEGRRLSNVIDGYLVYSLVSIFENENNPDNLLLCFGIVSYILKNFDELEPYIDDIFEWLQSYFPVDYTPTEKDDKDAINIQRSDLVQALYDCFYASPLNADNLQTMLLEKLDSNVPSTKLESLECLMRCYERFPLSSIQKYNSTLWTAIRMNCLRKANSLDQRLMEASLRALTALAKRLTENDELFMTFIGDMYEELAIVFRKPEMELFEPAAKLMTHAALPSIKGFNYLLEKILNISINALDANELRPLPGLAYVFQQLQKHHPSASLKSDLNLPIKKLLKKLLDKISPDDDRSLDLVESLLCHETPLEESDLNGLITKLWELKTKSNLDIERCLALVCLKYRRSDIICHEELAGYDLESLFRLIHSFNLDKLLSAKSAFPTDLSKLSVYLRLLVMQLDQCQGLHIDHVDQRILNQCLIRMREIASSLEEKTITERIASVHSIVLNKLSAQNVDQKLMDMFNSDYCQKLVPSSEEDLNRTAKVYLPIIASVFKSLVARNHQLATPLINLFLNFITSDKVNPQLALEGSRVFSLVQSNEDDFYSVERHYQVFWLRGQKFYMQTNREIRIRYENQPDEARRDLLLCALALQIPHLPLAVFRRDYDWLVRQLLKVLSKQWTAGFGQRSTAGRTDVSAKQQDLFYTLFGCLENMIQRDLAEHLVSFLPSLIDLCLRIAHEASSMQVRKQALICLTRIAGAFSESDLLTFRPKVVDQLSSCLADKKRLVRQAAADARLRWVLIGQPIGSA